MTTRRALFGMLGLAAAGTAAAAVGMKEPRRGFTWKARCHNGHESEQFIDLSKTLGAANQCPQCLAVLDLSDLGKEILNFNAVPV